MNAKICITLILSLIWGLQPFKVFGQGSIPAASAPPYTYKDVYYGPTVQSVMIDRSLNQPAPAPFDRFFLLKKYVPAGQPAPVFIFEEFDLHVLRKTGALPLYTLLTRPVANPGTDSIKGYVLYETIVPPLAPNRTYRLFNFNVMTEAELHLLTTALKYYYADDINGTSYADALKIIEDINDAKRMRDDKFLVDKDNFCEYYRQKIKPKINYPGANQDDVILKELKQDFYVDLPATPGEIQQVPVFQDEVLIKNNFDNFSLDSRTSSVVTVDVGFVFYGFQKNFFNGTPYIGIDYFLRPFDPQIPFTLSRRNNRLSFFDHVSLNIGVTLVSVAKTNYRADLFSTKNNLIIGAGYRFNNVFKFNFGTLIYDKLDPNFLTGKKTASFTGYAGISMDIRIGSVFNSFSKIFSL